ncbi:unnamed protein product [Larinioides sclopetarius]|uniref:HTH psq-type domain-containing protein n=1 Tax=Larinioides sclopetarius TaxID=280406 RepID=A0AAV1YZ21_9ARAC
MAPQRKSLTMKEKYSLMKDIDFGMKNKDVSRKYGIAESTVSTILKNRALVLKTLNSVGGDRKRSKSLKSIKIEEAVLEWIKMARDKNMPVCGNHFRGEDFQTFLKTYSDKTGEFIRVPLAHKRRLPGSVGNSPSLASSEPSSTRENHEDKGKIKETEDLKPVVVSLQKQIKKEECEQFPAIQKPCEKSNLPNPKYLTVISNKNTISRNEPQNVAEMSTVIKQEPEECADEPPQLVIEKVLGAEEILSSSRSSASSGNLSSSCASTPFLENSLPFGSHGSTHMDETSATNIPNKSPQKGKINNADQTKLCQHTKPSKLSSIHILRPTHVLHPLDSKDTAATSKKSTRRVPNANEAKLCRRTKLSMPDKTNMKRKLDPPAEAPKKFEGYLGESGDVGHRHPTLPTQNDETATREIFQSLFDGSNNNSLFTSRTAERPGDLFDVFADFIASKLRVMDWDECAYALRAVLDIVTQTGKVEHNSEVKRDISSPNTTSLSSNQE